MVGPARSVDKIACIECNIEDIPLLPREPSGRKLLLWLPEASSHRAGFLASCIFASHIARRPRRGLRLVKSTGGW